MARRVAASPDGGTDGPATVADAGATDGTTDGVGAGGAIRTTMVPGAMSTTERDSGAGAYSKAMGNQSTVT